MSKDLTGVLNGALIEAARKEPRWLPILTIKFHLGDWSVEEKELERGEIELTIRFAFGGIGKWRGKRFKNHEEACRLLSDMIIKFMRDDENTFNDIVGKVVAWEQEEAAKSERKKNKKSSAK